MDADKKDSGHAGLTAPASDIRFLRAPGYPGVLCGCRKRRYCNFGKSGTEFRRSSALCAPGEEPVAVADYSYMSLDIPLLTSTCDQKYAITGEWLYYTEPVLHEDGRCYNHISRRRIAQDERPKDYIVCETPMEDLFIAAMLTDSAENCYLFSVPRGVDNIDGLCYLEKYGTKGELVWQVAYEQEKLQDMARRLTQGTVTEEGAVYLYSQDAQSFPSTQTAVWKRSIRPGWKTWKGLL